MHKSDLGLIGLAVMGQNLVLNMERNGYAVMVYNRTREKSDAFLRGEAAGKRIAAAYSLKELVGSLKRPRVLILMIKAGPPVDQIIDDLSPYLEKGDLIIDGGNSFFLDTQRRAQSLENKGLNYLGVGISGGEEGALWGPSIMPGGSRQAYQQVEPIFSAIAARADDGQPCVTYIGPGGAGHYVKMVHNGIEYGDMQLIAEAYDILRRGLGLPASKLHPIFADWNQSELSSYLIEITADILAKIDQETGQPLVDLILDEAEQKGTGKWTSQNALDLGVATPTINAAVEARILSAYKTERTQAAKALTGPAHTPCGDPQEWIEPLGEALYAAKILSYAQGFALLRAASAEYGYGLKLAEIARIWRAGCIIRARFLDEISAAFQRSPELPNMLMDAGFGEAVGKRQAALRSIVSMAVEKGIPVSAFSSALAYYDAYRSERLPANLIQAQRDYFGAHTYRRIDREGIFHTDWISA